MTDPKKDNSIRCPKCGNMKIKIIEHIVVPEVMYQNVLGHVTHFTGESGGDCYVVKRMAKCLMPKCKHVWQLRRRGFAPSVMIPDYASTKAIEAWLNGETVYFSKREEEGNE